MTNEKFSLILSAGGIGSRMGATTPKQFLMLGNKPISIYSLDIFLSMPETAEVIIVCAPEQRHYFNKYPHVKWALPGERRQDSIWNGLQQVSSDSAYVCTHDACRPFINTALVRRVFKAACECGAASAGMPVRYTIKEIDQNHVVVNTPNRDYFWEIQTPQIIQIDMLKKGFKNSHSNKISVNDEASLAELIGAQVKLVQGDYANIKITTPDDLAVAENLLKSHG